MGGWVGGMDVPFHAGRGHAGPHHQAGVVRHAYTMAWVGVDTCVLWRSCGCCGNENGGVGL